MIYVPLLALRVRVSQPHYICSSLPVRLVLWPSEHCPAQEPTALHMYPWNDPDLLTAQHQCTVMHRGHVCCSRQ